MKKVLMAVLAGVAVTAYSAVNVDWKSNGGFYFTANPAVGILGDGTGNSTIAQLMYSPDNVKDNILSSMIGDVNDVIWDTVTITENGVAGDFDDFIYDLNQNYTAAWNPIYASGFVYALIFQDDNVQGGDWYLYTPMLSLQDIIAPSLPQSIVMNSDFINGNAIDSDTGMSVAQVVPEPATALLFGMGAMGAWLIRRNKIKSKEAADA